MTFAVLSAALLGGVSVKAATTNFIWNVASGNYTNDTSWLGGYAPLGSNPANLAPSGSVNYQAFVTNGGTVSYGDGGGGPSTGYTWTNFLGELQLGGTVANGSGAFTMSSDTLTVSNSAASDFMLGGANPSTGSFTMNGGTLNAVRNAATFYQDFLIVANAANSTGTFTINGGFANLLCGVEIGNGGSGTFNMNGGIIVDNGWFGVGRGATTGNSSANFNLTSGTLYILPNSGGTVGGAGGLCFNQGSTNALVNISGGAIYVGDFAFAGSASTHDILNISGGTINLGWDGVYTNTATVVPVTTISGGTFHTVDFLIAGGNGAIGSTNNILSDGTNWTWGGGAPINLTNSSFLVNGVSGPGYVTFAPEPNRTITLNSKLFGVGGLVLNGPGNLALGTANTYTGGTTINQGNLILNNGGSVPDSTLTVPSGSTFVLNESSAINLTNIVAGAGNVLLTGSGTVNVANNLQNSGAIVQSNGALVVNGTILNASSISNNGPASGPFVAQGTITSPIWIGANSALELGSTALPGTLNAGNVTLNGTWDLKINTANTTGGGVNDLLICNNLTLGANSILNVLPQSLPNGSYVIAEYSGTLTTNVASGFGTVTDPTSTGTYIVSFATPGEVILNVSGVAPASLTWATPPVGGSNLWDVAYSTNWLNGSSLTNFHQQDAVTFSNAAPNPALTNRVSINTQVLPSSVTISGGLPYIFSGFGYISGGTGITYNDTNTSGIYTGGNNYTGPVNINNGVLQLGSGGSSWLGTTNGATYVNGGTLDLNAQGVGAEPLVIQGTGSAYAGTNSGAINNSSSSSPGQSAGPLNITLAGNTTLNASGNRWDIGVNTPGAGGGSFAGNGHNLVKIGGNAIWMHEVGDIGVGNIDIQQGLLGFRFTIGMGISSDTVTVEPGAEIAFYQLTNSILNKQMVMNGNATMFSGGNGGSPTSNTFVGPVTLNGTNSIQTTGFPLNLAGAISGAGGYLLTGVGPLYLTGTNTYTGPTILGAGGTSIILGPNGSINNTALIYMTPSSNTVLNASAPGSFALGSGQTLEGSGSIIGNATANAGSSIIVGTNSTTYGAIVFTNNLTLNGNTNYLKISDNNNVGIDNDLIIVDGNLNLSGVSTLVISPLAALVSGADYTVISSDGGISSGGIANLRVISASPRYTMSPVINGGSVQVSIMGNSAPLLWKGNLTPNWDLVTSNWYNMSTANADHFYNGDEPTFDDSSAVDNVVVTNNVIVAGIYMSNVNSTYTFSGGGVITGPLNIEGDGNGNAGSTIVATTNIPNFTAIDLSAGNLVFAVSGAPRYFITAPISDNFGNRSGTLFFGGTNTAVLAADNGSAGLDEPIIVTNGILQYTNFNCLGNTQNPIFATNNGTIDFNGVNADNAKIAAILGNGYNGMGALYDSANNTSSGSSGGAINYINFLGDASFGAPANFRWDQNVPTGSGGQINGNGFKLTKVGLGTVFINSQISGDTGFGNVEVAAGRLGLQGGPIELGNSYLNDVLSVDSNAIVTFFAFSNEFDTVHGGSLKPMWLKGSAAIDSGGASNNYSGPIFLSGTNLFGTRTVFHVWNSMMDSNGPGGFILGNTTVGSSAAAMILDGTNTYSGPTVVSNATLRVGANSSLGLSTNVQVNSGATLDLSQTPSYNIGTVATNQTLAGNGTVVGPATGNLGFSQGGTLAVGLPNGTGNVNTNTFTLTISNSVVFNSGSVDFVVANKTSAAAGAVPVDKVAGLTSLTLGGTLVVTNYGRSLVAGDTLALFSATTIVTNSSFTIVPSAPGAGLIWNFSTFLSAGTLQVASSSTVNQNPTNITFHVSSGGQMTLSWPADHTGWELEIQTNKTSVGIVTNSASWIPDPASTTVNSIMIPINLTNGTVFYRLVYPPQ